MSRHGLAEGDFVYVADSAMVTEDNLDAIGNNTFVTRLPFNYKEASRVVTEAVAENCWTYIGTLNETPPTSKRPAALYRFTEKSVTLYEKEYRAIVVHSTANDKRRLKRIDREICTSKSELRKLVDKEIKWECFCEPDAEVIACRLRQSGTEFHGIETSVIKKIKYARGRPKKDGTRKIASIRYVVDVQLVEKKEHVELKRKEAGCFVLLTNVPIQDKNARTGSDLLRLYKEQHGIERNYSFLKDPLIVNDMFLKSPARLEVLGAILLIALLIWNLIEHVLRQYVTENNTELPGWDKKKTRRPTAFMMSTKFYGLQIVRFRKTRHLARALTEVQLLFLEALGLEEHHLLNPKSAYAKREKYG